MNADDHFDGTTSSVDLLARLAAIADETVIDPGTLTATNPKTCWAAEPRDLEGVLRKFYFGEMLPYAVQPDFGSTLGCEMSSRRMAARAIRRALESSHGVDYSGLYDATDVPVLALGRETVLRAEEDPGKTAVEEIIGVLRFARRVGALISYVRNIETAVGALAPAKDIDREAVLEIRAALKDALERSATLIEGGMRFDAKPQFVRAARFLAALQAAVRDEMLHRPGAQS